MLKVSFKKYFLQGFLEGLTIEETMRFVDWDTACWWAGQVTMSFDCDYVILEMTNPETGEVANF